MTQLVHGDITQRINNSDGPWDVLLEDSTRDKNSYENPNSKSIIMPLKTNKPQSTELAFTETLPQVQC